MTSASLTSPAEQHHPLIELEMRQDEALRQLEALVLRIEAALAEFTTLRPEPL
jgi:hypothetical protein